MNGKWMPESSEAKTILKEWVDSGYFLGNHTFSHADLNKLTLKDYLADIEKNTSYFSPFETDKTSKFFRYPFLHEGNSSEKRNGVRKYLSDRGYQIAEVTVDFFDWEWNAPYVRCLEKNDQTAIAWLKSSFLENALNAIEIAEILSKEALNKPIKHIFLIHLGGFQSIMIDELLTKYKEKGIQFIPLESAAQDPVYATNPNFINDSPYTFLNQLIRSKHLPNPTKVNELYNALPEEKLEKLCR